MLKHAINIALLLGSCLLIAQNKQGKKYFDSDSSKVKEIYHYDKKDKSLNGLYESFYLNGSLQTLGWYEGNQPDSIWTYYYENGRKKSEGRFENGQPNGKWSYYFENGNIKSWGSLINGLKNEGWVFFFENGGEKSRGSYSNDKKSGIWNYYFEEGKIKAQSYIENGSGNYVEFYPSGERRMEGVNKDGKSNGEWTYFYETGEIEAVGIFENGLRVGRWVYYHKNERVAGTGSYQNGIRKGEWNYYHDNGQVSQSGTVINDQKDGYWKLFYPSGEVLGEATYDQGAGDFIEFYPNGNQKSKGEIVDGEKTGKWVYYSENGGIDGEADLAGGKGFYTGYYPSGTVKMKGQIKDDKREGEWVLFNPDGSFAGTYTPIYENEKPIFKTRESSDLVEKEQFNKPEYLFKKQGLRYFRPIINEYRGVIIGSNPLWLINNQIPIAIEYYMQERLGYELQLDIIRNPFFTSNSDIGPYQVYTRGMKLHFRQKLYNQDQNLGMFYFGHEVSFSYQNHQAYHVDTVIVQDPRYGALAETSIGYGLFIGNRWMKDAGNTGLTLDTFIGIGISKRSFTRKDQFQVLDTYFDPLVKSIIHFPLIIGINIGFSGPRSKSKTQ